MKQLEPKDVTEEGIVMLVKPEHQKKQQSPNEVTEEGIVMLLKPEHSSKQLSPKEVTEEGIVILFNPLQSLNVLSANAVTGYSTPLLAFTFPGTTILPVYFSPLGLAVSVAVLASESIR